MSRSRLRVLIEEGRVTANGQPATDASAKVIAGAALRHRPARRPSPPCPSPRTSRSTWCSRTSTSSSSTSRPASSCTPPAGPRRGTLVNALLFHCGPELTGIGGVARPGIVHRLDKDTSGVMVAAKSEAAHTALTAMFAAHDIERAYLAVTRGAPRPLVGRIETNIGRSPNDRKKMAVMKEKHFRADHWSDNSSQENDAPAGQDRDHQLSRHWKPTGVSMQTGTQPAAALVECRLETGRTHQIRVHMAHIQRKTDSAPHWNTHRQHSTSELLSGSEVQFSSCSGQIPVIGSQLEPCLPGLSAQCLEASLVDRELPAVGNQRQGRRPRSVLVMDDKRR